MSVEDRERPAFERRWRIAALLALLAGFWAIGHFTGAVDHFSVEEVRSAMQSAGWLGVVLFLVAFAVGELLHVVGIVFVVAAVLAYGQLAGGALAYLGAVLSVSVSFAVVRFVGGQPLGELRWRWARRALDRLDERPLRVVILLRLVFWMFPPLNYVLAMSRVRFLHYLVGSAIGLVLPIGLCALFVDAAYQWLR